MITVTNSVAHLAGALGAPVRIVFTPAWGAWWILNGGVTPWYPSATVYSRAQDVPWESLADELVLDLPQSSAPEQVELPSPATATPARPA